MTDLNVIYGLHSGDEVIRYVGKTSKGARVRLGQHISVATHQPGYPVHRWMRKHGVGTIQFTILEVLTTESDSAQQEIQWIEKLGTLVPTGLNVTTGGEGVPGRVVSEPNRQRLSHSHLGNTHTADTRAKMSATRKAHGTWNRGVKGEGNSMFGKKNPGAAAAARLRAGSLASSARLTEEQIPLIFALRVAGADLVAIGENFEVSATTVRDVLRRTTWRHVMVEPRLVARAAVLGYSVARDR